MIETLLGAILGVLGTGFIVVGLAVFVLMLRDRIRGY